MTQSQWLSNISGVVLSHPPGPGEVRVALRALGICHADYNSLNWGYYHVLGHDGAGIVESVGEGVSHVTRCCSTG
jgi:Zn-dependent alcohol dehydrogenase